MQRLIGPIIAAALTGAVFIGFTGCGTTRSTDTTRTATEQLLISDAIDRAVQSMSLKTLAGQTVYLDDSKLSDVVDRNYFISTLRQYLLANGCELRDKREDADFIVEARAGAVGTDRNDLLFGVPSINMPQIPLVQPVPAVIPEIPIAKRKDQRGIAKIAVFAYHRATGTPVWQSGIVCRESSANDVWILGAGPFQHGTIYQGTEFAGNTIGNEDPKNGSKPRRLPVASVSKERLFTSPQRFAKKDPPKTDPKVALASHQTPATPTKSTTPAAALAPTVTPTTSDAKQVAAQPPGTTASAAVAALPPAVAVPLAPAATAAASTSVDPPVPASVDSAYTRLAEPIRLPQPRFNSAQ
jgi:Family of unknown function (DUF6655)